MGNLCLAIILFAVSSVSTVEYTVVRVIDGDTVVLSTENALINLDLAHIDAPELGSSPVSPCQPLAREAKRYLEERLVGKNVYIIIQRRESSQDWTGTLFLNGENLNLTLVRLGLAEVCISPGLSENSSLKKYLVAQEEAWSAKRGIWGLGSRYTRPCRWRERRKERSAMAALLYLLVSQPRK